MRRFEKWILKNVYTNLDLEGCGHIARHSRTRRRIKWRDRKSNTFVCFSVCFHIWLTTPHPCPPASTLHAMVCQSCKVKTWKGLGHCVCCYRLTEIAKIQVSLQLFIPTCLGKERRIFQKMYSWEAPLALDVASMVQIIVALLRGGTPTPGTPSSNLH